MKLFKIVSLFLITIFFGCAGFIKTEVTVFHDLPEHPSHLKYSFFALKDQENNLEYLTYQKLIRSEFKAHRFIESDIEYADVIVLFGYAIDNGTQELSSIPIIGQTGVSSSTTHGTITSYGNDGYYSGTTIYRPTYGVVGTQTTSRTKYGRDFMLKIIDKEAAAKNNLKILYEGRVKSSGSSSQLSLVVPAMIKAMFKQFPGQSGSSRTEMIPRQ